MKLTPELNLKQSPKIILTPQLRQAINLLRMPAAQLAEYVEEELHSNPLLEWDEASSEKEDEKVENNTGLPEEENGFHEDYHSFEYFADDTPRESGTQTTADIMENLCSEEETLSDYVFSQLRLMLDKKNHFIAEYLTGCLDINGYLKAKSEEVAYALNVPLHRVREVIDFILFHAEPAGIGARDLRECLMVQIKRRGDYPPLAQVLISGYLPDIAAGHINHIAEQTGASPDEVMTAVEYIRTLNPKPGSFWGQSSDTRYVIPDVIVEKTDADYVIIIPDHISSHIKISPYYRSFPADRNSEEYAYIKKQMNRAMWLLKSIEQRRLTLYRVSESIVKMQREYLDKGLKSLQPLTLKNIADELGLHESTVSRVVSGKYMQTPRGTLPFKFFFSSSVKGRGGQKHSSASIKTCLQEIFRQETPGKPRSDSEIAATLKAQGINISRRTVAKYRKELFIPSSHHRTKPV